MFEKYRQHIEFLEQLTPGVDADAAMMQQTDHEAYADRISDSIAALVKEDFDFDVTDNASDAQSADALADTQVFATVAETPKVQHVSLADDTSDVPADGDLLEALAEDPDLEALLSEE